MVLKPTQSALILLGAFAIITTACAPQRESATPAPEADTLPWTTYSSLHMDHAIAHLELVATWPTGERRPIRFHVDRPVHESPGEWSCVAQLTGLCGELLPMRGEDALQALCLALGLCAFLLRSHVASGGGLQYSSGEEFPLEAYFGWLGALAD